MSSSQPIKKEVATIRSISENDPLVLAILDTIPPKAIANGVLSVPELKLRSVYYIANINIFISFPYYRTNPAMICEPRFRIVHKEMRKAALAPPQTPSLFGQIIGEGLALITSPPQGESC
jgi:hypothetical protein